LNALNRYKFALPLQATAWIFMQMRRVIRKNIFASKSCFLMTSLV